MACVCGLLVVYVLCCAWEASLLLSDVRAASLSLPCRRSHLHRMPATGMAAGCRTAPTASRPRVGTQRRPRPATRQTASTATRLGRQAAALGRRHSSGPAGRLRLHSRMAATPASRCASCIWKHGRQKQLARCRFIGITVRLGRQSCWHNTCLVTGTQCTPSQRDREEHASILLTMHHATPFSHHRFWPYEAVDLPVAGRALTGRPGRASHPPPPPPPPVNPSLRRICVWQGTEARAPLQHAGLAVQRQYAHHSL